MRLSLKLPEFKKTPDIPISEIALFFLHNSYFITYLQRLLSQSKFEPGPQMKYYIREKDVENNGRKGLVLRGGEGVMKIWEVELVIRYRLNFLNNHPMSKSASHYSNNSPCPIFSIDII